MSSENAAVGSAAHICRSWNSKIQQVELDSPNPMAPAGDSAPRKSIGNQPFGHQYLLRTKRDGDAQRFFCCKVYEVGYNQSIWQRKSLIAEMAHTVAGN